MIDFRKYQNNKGGSMLFINGRFLTQKVTGVQRFAIELVKQLDKIAKNHEIEIVTPPGIICNLNLNNISIRIIGRKSNNFWTQWTLPLYVKKNKGILFTITGMAPILKPDYFVAHDVTFCRHPESFTTFFVWFYKADFVLSLNRCKKIFTVSEFSKNELSKEFSIDEKKFVCISPSSQHLANLHFNKDDLKKWNLKDKKYYLSVSSKALHKNQQYIFNLAKKYTKDLFVIVGGTYSVFNNIKENKIDNVIFTGYVSDDELTSLYKYAYGFIFPSIYEGFGIPPLEAISLGVKRVAVSDIPVFREIYKKGVYFFDPNSVDSFSIEEFDKTFISESSIDYYRKNFSWEKSAQIVYKTIFK